MRCVREAAAQQSRPRWEQVGLFADMLYVERHRAGQLRSGDGGVRAHAQDLAPGGPCARAAALEQAGGLLEEERAGRILHPAPPPSRARRGHEEVLGGL